MTLKSYNNANDIAPAVGDIVEWSGGYDYDFSRNSNKKLEVIGVKENVKSYSIIVKNSYGNKVSKVASKFDLIESSGVDTKITEKKPFVCIMNNKVVHASKDLDEAKEAAIKFIRKNEKAQVLITEVRTVAKVKQAPIDFV